MIKAIIFDVGGVYMVGSFVNFVNKSQKFLGINKKISTNKKVTFDPNFNREQISAEKCFQKYFKIPISNSQMKKIIKIWASTWKPNPAMIKLITKLQKNYHLAILSNSDPLNSPNYFQKGWYRYFDTVILSHELGILKPDPQIYQITLDKLKVQPHECVFIDDQIECLKPAQKLGMNTILFKSPNQLQQDLKKLNLLL